MLSQTSRSTYGAFLVILLSSALGANAQSACGLQGYSSCTQGTTRSTGYGCCPTGYACFATECEYTGTPTSSAVPTTTACPGIPAHHLCPQSAGGGCCYNPYACDHNNVSQCILTQTQRVFDEIVTTTTVVNGATQTITSTSIFYPWGTTLPRTTPGANTTPSATAPSATTPPSLTRPTSTVSTAAAGHVEARVGGVVGGILAGILAH
ncbi:hypothetical protein B0T14DRAFT_223493 [Immersiella caudata]|uniref:Uncharacterized protein n=1 Tax=Immersiella caudata TaxID=314043 RepID=A0AA39WRL2_9PEZI|nr:hypothetical protein B0T14DRAFT_223493 [Immersiella caudata]